MGIKRIKTLILNIVLFVCIAGISLRLSAQKDDLDAVMYKVGMLMLQEKYYLEALAIKMNNTELIEYDSAILAQRIAEFYQRMKNEERYKYYKALSQKIQAEIDEKSSQE